MHCAHINQGNKVKCVLRVLFFFKSAFPSSGELIQNTLYYDFDAQIASGFISSTELKNKCKCICVCEFPDYCINFFSFPFLSPSSGYWTCASLAWVTMRSRDFLLRWPTSCSWWSWTSLETVPTRTRTKHAPGHRDLPGHSYLCCKCTNPLTLWASKVS